MTPDTIIAATHYALRFTVLHRLDEEFHSARGPKELRALYFRTLSIRRTAVLHVLGHRRQTRFHCIIMNAF